MKKKIGKKFFNVFATIFFIALLPTISSADSTITDEVFNEDEYSVITSMNIFTGEKNYFNVPTQNIGKQLEKFSYDYQGNTYGSKNTTVSPQAIIGYNDERELITDTKQFPYSAIAFLEITWDNNEKYCGTAFMIAPNKALTAAHCVLDENNRKVKKLEIMPAKNGAFFWNNPYGSASIAEAENIYYPAAFDTNKEAGNDWAILKLNEDIGNKSGWLELQVNGFSYGTEGETFHTSGYPVHDPNDTKYKDFRTGFLDQHAKEYQFHSSSIITNVYTNYFKHKIDTLPGQSGSPIYKYDSNNNVKVIGIHNQSGEYSILNDGRYFFNYNKAAKITYTIINAVASI